MHDTLFRDTIDSIGNLPMRLGNFMRNYKPCIKTAPSRANMKLYVAGQVGTLERKNVENIALEAGVPPRTLQNHLAQNNRDEDAVAYKNRDIIRRDHFDENAIGIIDETSDPKKGEKTVGRPVAADIGAVAKSYRPGDRLPLAGEIAGQPATEGSATMGASRIAPAPLGPAVRRARPSPTAISTSRRSGARMMSAVPRRGCRKAWCSAPNRRSRWICCAGHAAKACR